MSIFDDVSVSDVSVSQYERIGEVSLVDDQSQKMPSSPRQLNPILKSKSLNRLNSGKSVQFGGVSQINISSNRSPEDSNNESIFLSRNDSRMSNITDNSDTNSKKSLDTGVSVSTGVHMTTSAGTSVGATTIAADDSNTSIGFDSARISRGRDEGLNFFSFYPEVIQELGLRELNTGETYSAYEQQKLYQHILQKDLTLLRDRKTYEKANRRYYERKKDDPFFKAVTGTRMLGANGNFDEIDNVTTYNRWKMTTKPYGAVAHKRYTEWRDNILEGEKAVKIHEQDQVKKVRMLWDDIRFNREGKIEAKIKSEIEKSRSAIKVKTKKQLQQESEIAMEQYRQIMKEEKYHLLHRSIEQIDHDFKYRRSEKPWNKGFHPEFDIENGFPKISSANLESSTTGVVKDVIHVPASSTTAKTIKEKPQGMEDKFVTWSRQNDLMHVDKHLKEVSKKKELSVRVQQRRTIDKIRERRTMLKNRSTLIEKMDYDNSAMTANGSDPLKDTTDAMHGVTSSSLKRLPDAMRKDLYLPLNRIQQNDRFFKESLDEPSKDALEPNQTLELVSDYPSFEYDKDKRDQWAWIGNIFYGFLYPHKPSKAKPKQSSQKSLEKSNNQVNPLDDNSTVQSILSMSTIMSIRKKPKNSNKFDLTEEFFQSINLSDEKLEKILDPLIRPTIYSRLKDFFTGRVNSHQLFYLQGDKRRAKIILRECSEQEQREEELFLDFVTIRRNRVVDRQAFYRDIRETITRRYEPRRAFKACKDGSYRTVIDILDHPRNSVGPNDYNDMGESALYSMLRAILHNENYPLSFNVKELSLLSMLLYGRHLLQSSLRTRQWTNIEVILRVLMLRGGDLDFIRQGSDGNENYAIIHLATMANDVLMLSWLHNRKANINLLSHPSKRTALSFACERDSIETALFLIRNGAVDTIDSQDRNGCTALHHAAMNGSVDLVKVLLLCGINSKLKNKKGLRAFEEAQKRGRYDIVEQITSFHSPDLPYNKRLGFLYSLYKDRNEPEMILSPRSLKK